jgi:hypothetical protein
VPSIPSKIGFVITFDCVVKILTARVLGTKKIPQDRTVTAGLKLVE